jgi:ATP synthase protein I
VTTNVLADAARQSLRILMWQAGAIVVFALVCSVVWGVRAGASALAGGAIGLFWTAYMAWILFKHSLSHGARMSAFTFLAAWVIKLVMTVSLLFIAIRSRALLPLAVLAGLGMALVTYWVLMAFPQVTHAVGADGK